MHIFNQHKQFPLNKGYDPNVGGPESLFVLWQLNRLIEKPWSLHSPLQLLTLNELFHFRLLHIIDYIFLAYMETTNV